MFYIFNMKRTEYGLIYKLMQLHEFNIINTQNDERFYKKAEEKKKQLNKEGNTKKIFFSRSPNQY